jgi:hypothetical protein
VCGGSSFFLPVPIGWPTTKKGTDQLTRLTTGLCRGVWEPAPATDAGRSPKPAPAPRPLSAVDPEGHPLTRLTSANPTRRGSRAERQRGGSFAAGRLWSASGRPWVSLWSGSGQPGQPGQPLVGFWSAWSAWSASGQLVSWPIFR